MSYTYIDPLGPIQKLTIGRNVLFGHMDYPKVVGTDRTAGWYGPPSEIDLIEWTFLPEFGGAVSFTRYEDNPMFDLEVAS